jgi:RNA polymerase sigma-70 factor (ECF subfamily)
VIVMTGVVRRAMLPGMNSPRRRADEVAVRPFRSATSSPEPADDELAARFASGEPGAVAELYRRYGRLVYAVSYRVLGDASLATDATQQTFVRAWQHAARFDRGRRLAPWLSTIASRTAIDIYRHNRRHRYHDSVDNLDVLTLAAPRLSSPPPSAEQMYDVWEVRRAVDTLPDQDRELIRLQHFQQLSHAEIADRLTIPLGTVKSRSYRAHRRLAGLLGHLHAPPTLDSDSPTGADAAPRVQFGCRSGRRASTPVGPT